MKTNKKSKIGIVLIVIVLTFIVYVKSYSYNIDNAVVHLENNALSKSHTCCAWFVMRAMQEGGCPIGIYPAWMYKDILPLHNFKKVHTGRGNITNNYIPQKGDIIVINKTKKHFWGHIAMYTGKQWISDFKQKKMNPYRENVPYVIFRYNQYNSRK